MSYGRNFDFRKLPRSNARDGRFVVSTTALAGTGSGGGVAGTGQVPIGAPVVATTSTDSQLRQVVQLATQAELEASGDIQSTSVVVPGQSGILVYEYGPAAFAGFDPYLTTYSDLGAVPLGASVQVISGDPTVKVVFTNTVANSFLGIRSYPGRNMINGFGATPTVAAGDFLVPGLGDDVNGYWQSQSSPEGAWLVITKVDATRLQVEAQMLF